MYDLSYLVNSTVVNGAISSEVQTVFLRPVNDQQIVAQRSRLSTDARYGGWKIANVQLPDLNPMWKSVHGDKTTVNIPLFAFVNEVSPKKQILIKDYSTDPKNALTVRVPGGEVVTVRSRGYISTSHTELASIHSELKIQGTFSQRIAKVEAQMPKGGKDALDSDKKQETDNWIAQHKDFNTSLWANGTYSSHPRGEYAFGPFDGKGVGPATGEKIVTEKRTFDRSHTRPNGDLYFGRNIGEHEDVNVMELARKHNENVLLFGPPGTGKTALAEAAYMNRDAATEAEQHGMVTILGTAETEVADFVGSYTQRPGDGFVWVDGPLVEAMVEGKVLLVDEIGLIDPKVLSVLYSVMDGRGELRVTQNPDRGTVVAKEGFYVIAATNPHAPGVQLSEALISRFTIQVEVDSDYDLALHLKVNKKVVEAARQMDRRRRTGDMLWAPQLRELFAFKRNEEIFGTSFAARSLVAGAPEIDRDTVADMIGKALKDTITPLRMEG